MSCNNITADDTVMIMWSSQAREDKFLDNKWYTPGAIPEHCRYNRIFFRNWLHTYKAVIIYLDSIGCESIF